MRNPFSKYWIIKCPDESERIVYKKADDAFPMCFKNITSSFKTAFNALEKVQANLGTDFKIHIHDLLLKLDDINSSMQSQFRAAYIVYQSDPCNRSNYLADEIQKITERENFNRRLQIFMDKIILINKGQFSDTVLESLIIEAKSVLLGPSINQNILDRLSEVTETVNAWQEK